MSLFLQATNFREDICDEYPDSEFMFMDGTEYDEAIIGVLELSAANEKITIVYDIDKVIEINMRAGMTEEEAVEHFSYNQSGGFHGECTPVFVRKFEAPKPKKKRKRRRKKLPEPVQLPDVENTIDTLEI